MNDKTDKALDDAVSALMGMRLDVKKETVTPLPTKKGLERRYRMTVDDKGKTRMEEVK